MSVKVGSFVSSQPWSVCVIFTFLHPDSGAKCLLTSLSLKHLKVLGCSDYSRYFALQLTCVFNSNAICSDRGRMSTQNSAIIPCACSLPLQDLHSGQRQPEDMERECCRRRPLHVRGQEPVWHCEQQRERHGERYFLLAASLEGPWLVGFCSHFHCRKLMSRTVAVVWST